VVALMRQYRPQVVVTFDADGGYGHLDHIMIQRATLAAYERSGNAYWYPEAGDPWQPLKLYYMVVPRSMMQDARTVFESRGLEFVMGTGLPNVGATPISATPMRMLLL
jgi:mycothiol S-conjugate amidase